jgi:hypothetical protein
MPDALKMRVVSRWTEEEVQFNEPPPVDRIEYLPWGTRTLKVALEGDIEGLVRLQPEPRHASPDQIVSHALGPDGEAIQVSWGGGWEKGVEVDCQPDRPNHAFFNVTHSGPEAGERYSLNLVARDEAGAKLGEFAVSLTRPQDLPPSWLRPQWRSDAGDGGLRILELSPAGDGTAPGVPFYLSRWWPECWLAYARPERIGVPPAISLRCQSAPDQGDCQVEVRARKDAASPQVTLATIGGDLQFPTCELGHIDATLYRMAGHWALRLWFFWLDKGVAQVLDTPSRSQREKRILANWADVQEIPDAERVDLVFDGDLNLRFLCTDLHWHELWAPYERSGPLSVSIAGQRRRDVYIRGQEGLRVVVAAKVRRHLPRPAGEFDPSLAVMDALRDPDRVAKAAGTMMHKHTPYFHDAPFEADLTSNDVREG